MKSPNCSKCIHYYITLDERHPKACRVFNIKGRQLPSIDVKRYTGHECPVYKEKTESKVTFIREDKIIDTLA